MSTKKRFTIAPDLASGLRRTMQSASHNQGQLHYDMMALDVIEPDPENPRKLLIAREEILHGLNTNDPDYQTKLKEREALKEIAESIKRIGVRNALEVYKNGVKYRILTGERRYWASLIAGLKSVPVRIMQKPDEFNLRYMQWVENIHRQDLSLWEKFNNLLLIADAYKLTHNESFSEQALQTLLGVSSVQAYRYFCLLKADDKVIKLVQLGKLNNLKLIQELVSMKDKGARNQILSWVFSAKEEVTSLARYRLAAGKHVNQNNTAVSAIRLGSIAGTQTAKQLFEIVLSDQRLNKYRASFQEIDWDSTKAISRAFRKLFQSLEKECSTDRHIVHADETQ